LLIDDLLLYLARQMVPGFTRAVRAVQQKCRVRLRRGEHVNPIEKLKLMASNEVGPIDEVSRFDLPRTEPQV
jgi:hypothetical protein